MVGLGYIAQAAVLPAFAHARENSELAALISGSPTKLKQLSQRYHVKYAYSYQQFAGCLKSGEIDAVYVALPNNMHPAYTEAAARAGVHVLCEKPMAFDEDECRSMIAAAEEGKVKLMIAYRLHFERGNLQAIEIVNSSRIGKPRIFTSVFSQQVKPENSRLKKDVGGGPLWDMGIYCVNAARYLFRAEPEEVFAWNVSSGDKRFREVPEMTSALMKFPDNRIASFTTSFGAASRSEFEVIGTEGVLKMDPAFEMAEALKAEITINGRTTKKIFKKRDQFAPEILYFSDCILHNKQPEPSGVEGLADVRIIQAMLKSAATNQPITVPEVHVKRRPEMTQEISKEPVSAQPELVKAAAPGAE